MIICIFVTCTVLTTRESRQNGGLVETSVYVLRKLLTVKGVDGLRHSTSQTSLYKPTVTRDPSSLATETSRPQPSSSAMHPTLGRRLIASLDPAQAGAWPHLRSAGAEALLAL